MKRNRIKILCDIALCLVLLLSAIPFAASAQETPWVRDASSSGEIQLKLTGKLNGRGIFVFEGDTITYRHESEAEYPRDVTIDDMPWDDLTKPFKLDYATEAPKAVITSLGGPRTVKLRKSEGYFAIEIDDSVYTWPSYRIVIATKKQAERKTRSLADMRIQRPPSDFGMSATMWFPGMEVPKSGRPAFDEASGATPREESPYQNNPDAPMFKQMYGSFGFIDTTTPKKTWEEGIRERKITLEGQFFGNGTFIFEGNTITYRHETREYPSTLTVNDVIWGTPIKPFLLPFKIEAAEFELKQTQGDRPVRLTKVSDDRFEVFFKDPEEPPGSTMCRYSITITPKKDAESGNRQEATASAQSEIKPAASAQTGPQSMPDVWFPSLDMNGMPKSGRPAFGNPFEEQLFDGPTDGMAHPAVPVTRMIIPPDSVNTSTAKIDVRGKVDKAAGFRFGKWFLTYLDAAPDPDRTSDSAPVPFEGEQASDVSVLGRPWDNLSEPHRIFAIIDPALMTRIHFEAGNCDVRYFEHGEELDVIVTNRTDKPAEFAFTLWNGPERKPDSTPVRSPGPFQSMPEPRRPGGMGSGFVYSPKPREYPAGTVSVEGNFDGRGVFLFEENMVVYRHERDKYPTGVKINGKNWNDLTKPFELGFTPDHEHAAILEKEVRNLVSLTLKPDAFELLIDDNAASSGDYYVRIGKKPDPKPEETASEKTASPQKKAPEASPKKPMNPVFGPGREVVIKGTVDRDAGFRMEGNTLSYLNYLAEGRVLYEISPGMTSYPMNRSIPLYGGDFASGVTVNGKPWTNLTRPFELNVSHGKLSAKIIRVDAGQCEIKYQHYRDLFEIALSNKADKPVPFELTLWISDPAESK